MESNPRDFFNLLYGYLEEGDSGAKHCHQLLINLNDALTQEQVDLTYIDSYIRYFFHKTHGLQNFLSKIINKKVFKQSVIKVFEIIYTLVNNFSFKLKKFVTTIIDMCFKTIKSSLVTSDEKVISIEVLTLIFKNSEEHLENVDTFIDVYNNLLNSSTMKKCDSVQEKLCIALGTFAKSFQYLVTDKEKLQAVFLNGLETQMSGREFSNKAVSGLFSGFTQFCESFPLDLDSKEHLFVIKKLYDYIERLAVSPGTIKIANRAALTFLSNNISLFISLMVDKFKYWHETLLKWLSFGAEDQKVGVIVIEAYYLGLGNFLLGGSQKNVTLYFIEYFKEKIKQNISTREKRLCFNGLFSFSAVCQFHLQEEQNKNLLELIFQNFEQTYIFNQEPSNEALESLPYYLQTLSKFVHFKKISRNEIFSLQKGAILMIKTFPQLPYVCHNAVPEALILTFYYLLSSDEKMFDGFIEDVIYQGVVWTCSHSHISEAEILEIDSENVVSVRSYSTMWRGLLNFLPIRKYDNFGFFLQDRKYILIKIIDKLMRTMLILINKLNVSLVSNNTNETLTDIQLSYKVEKVDDYAIFLNLVDFYEDIFTHIDPVILKKCVCKLILHLISKCEKYCFVSGFYKLLSFCLKICKKINFFQKSFINTLEDITMCYTTLTKFAHTLLERSQQFTGDLLIACLQALLEYPILVVEKMLPACVSPFKTIFTIGRTYLKLANLALDTLAHWQQEITTQEFESFLIQVIPLLESYLQSSSSADRVKTNIAENRRKTSQALKKRKVLVYIEPELAQLQIKIINFVGQQNSSLCQAFAVSEINTELSIWANEQHLKVVLPYDIKLDVYLDKLLPRIINLALNSTDRKTKVAACEILQATVMIFLGLTKQMSHSGLSDVSHLLKHIAVPLLKLGCDMDQVVVQLFEPLCFQLVHWYTHPLQSRNEHSAIVIESILDSITHPTDTALRDFSGKCVNEFVKWSIKQSNEKNLARDPINIKILSKKMRFYSMHPDPYKKLGAALIFNNIYREIREEYSLLNIFWVEFFHIFIKSLHTLETDDNDKNLITQINNSLKHLERGLVEKSDLFNKNDAARRIPADISGGCLKDIAVWLLKQTGAKSHCRIKCMELFFTIARKSEGFTTLQAFVGKNFRTKTWVQDTYEVFLVQHPTLESLGGSEVTPFKWMEAFLCALDGYIFINKNKLLVASENVLSETLITSIGHYLRKISTVTLDTVFALIDIKTYGFTIFEKQHFDKQRSEAVLKIMHLFTICAGNLDNFLTLDLWNVVVNLIFNNQILGFECLPFDDDESQVASLLENFLKSLSENAACELANLLGDYVTSHFNSDFDPKGHVTLKQRNIVKGLNMIQAFGLKQFTFEKFTNGMVANLLSKFIGDGSSQVIYLDTFQATTLFYCNSFFNFALQSENEFKVFIKYLFEDYQVFVSDNKQPLRFGVYLLTIFEDSVISKIIENFEIFLSLCFQFDRDVNQTTEFIVRILTYSNLRREFRSRNQFVAKTLLTKWDTLERHFNQKVLNIERGLDLIKSLLPILKCSKLSSDCMKRWLIELLTYDRELLWKDETELKTEAFYLLVEIMDVSDDENDNLRCGLSCLKTKLTSDNSSLSEEGKKNMLDKLLQVMPRIRAAELFIFIIDVFANMSTESSNLDAKFLPNFALNDHQTQKVTLLKLYDLYSTENLDALKKYKLITNTIVLYQYCNITVFENFLVDKIRGMMDTLQQPVTIENLTDKILQLLLLEILFLRCPIQSSDPVASRIAQAALPQKPSNKIFLLHLFKVTLDVIKDSLHCTSDSDELFRLYKCHSYNAMVSIVTNSLKDSNFYTKLFIRQENGKEILWHGLIDTKKMYVFQTDFDNIPKQRNFLINIRDEMRLRKRQQNNQTQSIKYMESLRVYNSSLSEDVTKFDFTNSSVRSQVNEEEVEPTQSEIQLDYIGINTHECMANVCGLIEHMVRTGIITLPTSEDEDYELPSWFKAIRALLLEAETSRNVKIFWVKVIDNTVHIFKHFAKSFLEPLLKFIIDGCAGSYINYFITDVVAILATWSTEVVPSTESEVQLVSELITFLVNNLNNERQDIFKYHLQLIRLLIEAWKSTLSVPYNLILSKLSVDTTSKKVEIGIHLASIFLANRIIPWQGNNTDFCKILFKVVKTNNHRSVYKSAAETIGLILSRTTDSSSLKKLAGNVHVLLQKISEPDKHAYVLEGLVLHYPSIVNEYCLNSLLSRVYGVPKPIKVIYLRIILNRGTEELRGINDFKTERWDSYIENDHLEVQLLSLEIVHKCLYILADSPLFPSIVESVCKHVSNSNILCRTIMFNIITLVYQMGNASDAITNLCKTVLVQGLCDEDMEIRETVYSFWKNNTHLPNSVSDRLAYLLSNLYDINTENNFLAYCCYLLLETLKSNEEYNSIIFEHPLEDCDFDAYNLDTNWRTRHLSIAPLFAETVRSSSASFQSLDPNMGKVRQTQTSFQFTPTQSLRVKQFSQYTMSESSLFIKSNEDDAFLNPNLTDLSYKYRVPKPRFLRDKAKLQSHFARREVKKSVQKTEQRKYVIKEQENKVTIYRKYRKGDLPDVQISLQSVLEPLQALALLDGEISRILYSEISKRILEKKESDQDFMEKISTGIKNIFDTSTEFNRNLFRTLLDALLYSKTSIVFPPELLVTVCQFSGLRGHGALLIEEYLITGETCENLAKRPRGFQTDSDTGLWIKLAELYKEMDEWDVVKSIFLQKNQCPDDVKYALNAESRKHWKDAQDLYQKLIQTDESLERKDFYYESYFKCFAHLGEWNNLVESIDSVVSQSLSASDSWSSFWDQGFNQHKLLPWYISGNLKNILFTNTCANQFFSNLNTSLNDSNHLAYLETFFLEEIAMLWIFKGEIDEVEHYLKMYISNFLECWQQLDFFYVNVRFNKLLKLRNLVDMTRFINVFNNLNVSNISQVESLLRYWDRTGIENLPSILLSEEKALYRKQFLRLLTKRIETFGEEDFEHLPLKLNEMNFKLDDELMEVAIEENNFYMTKKYLHCYNNRNVSKRKLMLSKLAYIKSTMLSSPEDKLQIILKGCGSLASVFEEEENMYLKLLAHITFFKQFDFISLCLKESDELLQSKKSVLITLIGTSDISSADDVALAGAKKLQLFLYGYENYMESRMETDDTHSNLEECRTIANAYLGLAYFAMKQGKRCFSQFMLYVLRAMKFMSDEGRQLFPCILMEKEFSEEDKKQFMEETDKIPVWMLLGWIPQILTNIESSKVSAIAPLLVKIAEMYPQAIMYAYRLSKENYTSECREAKELIETLDKLLLGDKRIDTFLQALSFVGIPAAILTYYVRKIMKCLQSNDVVQVSSIQKNILGDIFNHKSDSRDVSSMQGNMFKKIAKYKKDFESVTKKSSGSQGILKQMQKVNVELGNILQDKKEAKQNSRLLKDYCPWLSNFSANRTNIDIEIPGQYDGKKMPLTHHHVRIASFCPNVSIMSSLRKPIKITIVGNDTKEYLYLVKFGEDIRQDQRIQQLFLLMNSIFAHDKDLNEHDFLILTYQVIPLTTNLGIIQWIENTNSLLEFAQTSNDQKNLRNFEQLFEIYRNWIYKSSNQQTVDAYGRAAKSYSRDSTIAKFNSLASSLEWDIFRKKILKLSTNTESFFAMRNNFIKSYAVLCASHWILGVGDRHLSNSLIRLNNGKVLGIDFGHAFGTATQILPVPELVPFRLTPHMVSLMKPLGEKGLFREVMIHCLRSLRSKSELLLSTMNVFIEEPSLDWLEHASRFAKDTDVSSSQWFPTQKIDQARRKLCGANSANIMIEDLLAGHQKNQLYMKAYINLVQGNADYDVRARMAKDDLLVEDQVDCLIDHATDYNLLGRMFEGWAAWV